MNIERIFLVGKKILNGFNLNASVGSWSSGSKNNSDDVETIQLLLEYIAKINRQSKFDPHGVDGQISRIPGKSRTVKAIRAFQSTFINTPDSRIDVNGRTLKKLYEYVSKAPVDVTRVVMTTANNNLDDFNQRVREWQHHFNTPPISDTNISNDLWTSALTSLSNYIDNDSLLLPHIITLVNFDLTSDQRRLWTINLQTNTVLHNVVVSHGRGSGARINNIRSCQFVSNIFGSNHSSTGAFITAVNSRTSRAGSPNHSQARIALEVDGLDVTNNEANRRNILFHGAHYVNRNRAGRSEGCFATEDNINVRIIDSIVGGSFVYSYKS